MSLWFSGDAWVYAEKAEDLVGLDLHFLMKGCYRFPDRTICKLASEGKDTSYYIENRHQMAGRFEEDSDHCGVPRTNALRMHIGAGSKFGTAVSGKRIAEAFPKAIVYSIHSCDVDPCSAEPQIHYGNESVKINAGRHTFLCEGLPRTELDIRYSWSIKAVIFDPVSATFATTKQLFDRIQAFERSL